MSFTNAFHKVFRELFFIFLLAKWFQHSLSRRTFFSLMQPLLLLLLLLWVMVHVSVSLLLFALNTSVLHCIVLYCIVLLLWLMKYLWCWRGSFYWEESAACLRSVPLKDGPHSWQSKQLKLLSLGGVLLCCGRLLVNLINTFCLSVTAPCNKLFPSTSKYDNITLQHCSHSWSTEIIHLMYKSLITEKRIKNTKTPITLITSLYSRGDVMQSQQNKTVHIAWHCS